MNEREEKERGREIETERQKNRQTDRLTNRQTEIHRDSKKFTEKDGRE